MLTKIKSHTILFFFLIILINFSYSQTDPWIRINPIPFEYSMNCISKIPDTDTIVAVGTFSTIMYTEDNGENWDIHLRPAAISNRTNLYSVSFPTKDIGYVLGKKSTLLKTTDGGNTWNDISLSGNSDYKEIYFINILTGFITGRSGHILKTDDGGSTWETIPTIPDKILGSIHFTDSLTGYLGNTNENYK